MAEDTPAASTPAADESVERAPAELKESTPEASKEKQEKANGSEEKPSGKQCIFLAFLPHVSKVRVLASDADPCCLVFLRRCDYLRKEGIR
jgi:hypothetical protein